MSTDLEIAQSLETDIQNFLSIGYVFEKKSDLSVEFKLPGPHPGTPDVIHLNVESIYRSLGDVFEITKFTFQGRSLKEIEVKVINADDEKHVLRIPSTGDRFGSMSKHQLLPYWQAVQYLQEISPPVPGKNDRCPQELLDALDELAQLKEDILLNKVDRTKLNKIVVDVIKDGNKRYVKITSSVSTKQSNLIIKVGDKVTSIIPHYPHPHGYDFQAKDNKVTRELPSDVMKEIKCKIIDIDETDGVRVKLLNSGERGKVPIDNDNLFWKNLNKIGWLKKYNVHDKLKHGGYTKSTPYRSKSPKKTRRNKRRSQKSHGQKR